MSEDKEIRKSGSGLFADIRQLIEQSRQNVAVKVNAEMSMLYWHIGKRIKPKLSNFRSRQRNYKVFTSSIR